MVQMDFQFLSAEGVEVDSKQAIITTLTVVDEQTGIPLAISVPTKSPVDGYMSAATCHFLSRLCRSKIILRTDGEPAITALAAMVRTRRTRDGFETLVQKGPRFSSQSMGAIGAAQKLFLGQLRTLRADIESRYKTRVLPDMAVFSWMVRHACWLLERFHLRSVGSTPFSECFGHSYRGEVLPFGECCLFRFSTAAKRSNKTVVKKTDLFFCKGVWLGKDPDSDEHIVATNRGVYHVRTVKRMQESEQTQLAMLQGVTAVPWNLKGSFPEAKMSREFLPGMADGGAFATVPSASGVGPGSEEPALNREAAQQASAVLRGDAAAPAAPQQSGLPASSSAVPPAVTSVEPRGSKRSMEDSPGKDDSAMVDDPSIPDDAMAGRVECVEFSDVCAVDHCDEIAEQLPPEEVEDPDGKGFDPAAVRKGKDRELANMEKYPIFRPVRRDLVDGPLISTRWECQLRGEEVRARFVAREFRSLDPFRDDVYTPASEQPTARIIDLIMVKRGWPAVVIDAVCAYFQAEEDENVFTEPPREWLQKMKAEGDHTDYVWKLVRQLYGRRGASSAFQQLVEKILVKDLGFSQCPVVPCIYVGKSEEVVEVHQDDFYATGERTVLRTFTSCLKVALSVKCSVDLVSGCSWEHLKRTRERFDDHLLILPNSKYGQKILRTLGLELCKPSPVPMTVSSLPCVEDDIPLVGEEITKYRSGLGLLRYLEKDRWDLSYACHELSCFNSTPTQGAMEVLKKTARYIKGATDVAIRFDRSDGKIDCIDVSSDANWAGCRRTRKSTSSRGVFVNGCLMSHCVAFQQTIATSSGEAEIYASSAAAVDAIHLRRVLEFCGYPCHIRLRLDASVAISFATRLGVGRLRHIDTRVLWLQRAVKEAQIITVKVPTERHVSDIGTKALAAKRLEFLMGLAGMVRRSLGGRSLREVKAEEDKTSLVNRVRPSEIDIASLLRQLVVAAVTSTASGARPTDTESCVVLSEGRLVEKYKYDYVEFPWLGLFFLLGVVVSMCCGVGVWLCCHSPSEVKTVKTKLCQSQCTYNLALKQPRFVALNEREHGCWEVD